MGFRFCMYLFMTHVYSFVAQWLLSQPYLPRQDWVGLLPQHCLQDGKRREYGALQSLIQGTSTVPTIRPKSLSSPSAPSQGQGGISSTWSVASMADLGQRWTVRNWNIGCTHCRAACESWQFRVPNTRSLFPVRRVSRCSLVSAAMVSKFDLKWHLCPPYALWPCHGLRTSTNNDYQQSKWSNTSLSFFLMLFWWAISRSVGEAISRFMVQW